MSQPSPSPSPSPLRSRPFSTAAKVYPSHLPEMMHMQQQSRQMPKKLIATVGILAAAGYGAQAYAASARDRRIAEAQLNDAHDAERRRQIEALNDVYGGRSTLEELEKAVQFYEKK